MKKIALAAILIAPSIAAAESDGLSYTYIEGSVSKIDVDGDDATGVGFSGSAALAGNLSLIGSYAVVRGDDEVFVGGSSDKPEVTTMSIGFSLHAPAPISDSSDFVLSAQYFDAEAEVVSSSANANGELYSLVLRTAVSTTTEVFGGVIHARGAGDGETGYSGGIRTGIHGALTGGVSYSTMEDVDSTSLFLRYNL